MKNLNDPIGNWTFLPNDEDDDDENDDGDDHEVQIKEKWLTCLNSFCAGTAF
jgi:hypothetical protein